MHRIDVVRALAELVTPEDLFVCAHGGREDTSGNQSEDKEPKILEHEPLMAREAASARGWSPSSRRRHNVRRR